MKKINNSNKFHGNNTIYSLNYKFDSVCSAGKFSGTALDLIKKYNELAKEAHSNGDYVEMEVFRQYAEHYRKIVTEINERKNQNRENRQANTVETTEQSQEAGSETQQQTMDNGLVETEAAEPPASVVAENSTVADSDKKTAAMKTHRRRSFTIVEVADNSENISSENAEPTKPRRGRKPLALKKSNPDPEA